MRPLGRWSYAPARREPGSRQPEQYALDVGPHPNLWPRKPEAFLLQSKVGRHGSPDHHVSHVEAPLRAARRHPAVLGGRDGRAPYFASIMPHVVRMEPRFAEVTVPKWFFVQVVEVLPPTVR